MKNFLWVAMIFAVGVSANPQPVPQYNYQPCVKSGNIVDERRKAKQTKINIYQTQKSKPVTINITPTNNNSHIVRRGKAGEKYNQTIGARLKQNEQIVIRNGCIN